MRDYTRTAELHARKLVRELGTEKAREVVRRKLQDAPFLVGEDRNFWIAVREALGMSPVHNPRTATNLIAVEEGGQYAPGAYIVARVFGTPGHYDWDERDEANTILVQTDWDFPGLARSFGWRGTTDNIEAARRYLDRVAGSKVVEDPGYFSSENPRHYGDLLHNPRERRWFPSALAIGVSRDGKTWYAHRIETDIGWDFPTIAHLFPFPIERVKLFGDSLVRVTFMPGDFQFKLKTDEHKWTRPLPLNTRLTPEEINAAAGYDITRTGASR